MATVPSAHRMPPALVPRGSLQLGWAAAKGTGGKIGKGWGFGGEIFAAKWDQAVHIIPRVCRKSW